jgi:spermidine/putrescine transport system substrate-binding protein
MSDQGSVNPRVRESMRRYEQALLSRRELLRKAGLGVVVLGAGPTLLAACGGGSESSAPEAPPPATEAPATEPATTAAGTTAAPAAEVPQASGTIDFLSWEGYDLPGPMEAWKKENKVTLKPTYIGNHNDIEAKLKASDNAEGYDLITYYQGFKPLYSSLEILSPIDEAKLPNISGLFPFFGSDERNFWLDPDGTRTGVPWTFGSQGIQYDSAVIKDPPTSTDILFDPKYKGKVVVVDDTAGNFALAAHLNGLDPGALTQDGFEQCKDLLHRVIAQTKGVAPSYGDYTTRFVSGDAVLGFLGWQAVNRFAADAGKNSIRMSFPDEGGISFCDSYAIPPGADNVDTVHAWINEVLDPHVHAAAAESLVAGVTVEAAVQYLSDEIAAFYPYDKLDELVANFPFYNNPPVESDEFVTFEQASDAWQELKSGA